MVRTLPVLKKRSVLEHTELALYGMSVMGQVKGYISISEGTSRKQGAQEYKKKRERKKNNKPPLEQWVTNP